MPPFDARDLRRLGFEGFVTVDALRTSLTPVPSSPGVYAVLRLESQPPEFLSRSPASRFKGKDPTVPVERLRREWVAGAQTLYLGSAKDLRSRVRLLIKFSDAGANRSEFHWGGRLLWQVEGSDAFMLAWLVCPPVCFRTTERRLVDEFREACGRMPFANLKRPEGCG